MDYSVIFYLLFNITFLFIIIQPNGVKFPSAYSQCLQVMFKTVSDIPLASLPLEESDRLNVALTLWAEGLLTVV